MIHVVWWSVGFLSDRIGDQPDGGLLEDQESVTDPQMPEWLGPPARTMPGISSQRATIFKTTDAMLVVLGFEAYATGVQFTLELWIRDDRSPINLHEWFGQRGTAPVATMLWFGVMLADGTAWTNVDQLDRPDDHSWLGERPVQPTLTPQGGGGTQDHAVMRFWLWPLPPKGSVTFVAEWPERGIPESTAVIDGAELRQVSEDASPIWE